MLATMRLSALRRLSAVPQLAIRTASSSSRSRNLPQEGPGLGHFIAQSTGANHGAGVNVAVAADPPPYIDEDSMNGHGRKVFFDVYGCQMNEGDAEVVHSVLTGAGYERTDNVAEADVWLLVTCSIRESAEDKIWKKLRNIQHRKKAGIFLKKSMKVGLLGCMAERLKDKLLTTERLVDVVAGPDAYRDLPRLFAAVNSSADRDSAINVMLSLDETYADIMPMRLHEDSVSGFVSIQRGCDNMCSYCIVPFTRGRERSRPVSSILDEVRHLAEAGVKEVTLLGQNVNSYRDTSKESVAFFQNLSCPDAATRSSAGFKSVYKPKVGGVRFADLLDQVSSVDPEVRVRFTSPHPKDFPDEVLTLIAERPNVCRQLHLPAQCGSSKVLEDMRRGYTREAYLDLVSHVRSVIPGVALSTDMIVGFCGETESEFEETLSLMREVGFHKQFLFQYSLREKTRAHRRLVDDVPLEVKNARMRAAVAVYREIAAELNAEFVGTKQLALVEGRSRRSEDWLQGRTDGGIRVNFPKIGDDLAKGDYVVVDITESNSQGLKGTAGMKATIAEFDLATGVRIAQ